MSTTGCDIQWNPLQHQKGTTTDTRYIMNEPQKHAKWAPIVFTRNIQKRKIYKDRNWMSGCPRLGLGTETNLKRAEGILSGETELCFNWFLMVVASRGKVTKNHWIEHLTWVNFTLWKSTSSAAWIKSGTYYSLEDKGVSLDQCRKPFPWAEWEGKNVPALLIWLALSVTNICWKALNLSILKGIKVSKAT